MQKISNQKSLVKFWKEPNSFFLRKQKRKTILFFIKKRENSYMCVE